MRHGGRETELSSFGELVGESISTECKHLFSCDPKVPCTEASSAVQHCLQRRCNQLYDLHSGLQDINQLTEIVTLISNSQTPTSFKYH